MTLLLLQVLSFSIAVVGKWHITSTCKAKRRRGFGLVVCSGLLFNGLLFYSGLHFSALAGVVLLCIDFRGFIHNGGKDERERDDAMADYDSRLDCHDVGC